MTNDNLTIWRIETEDGVGPGASGLAQFYHHIAVDALLRGDEQPCPASQGMDKQVEQDGLTGSVQVHDRFGCLDLETLRLWFPSPAGCAFMANVGAVLAAYEVPAERTKVAPLRAYFDHRYAKRVAVRSVNDLYSPE